MSRCALVLALAILCCYPISGQACWWGEAASSGTSLYGPSYSAGAYSLPFSSWAPAYSAMEYAPRAVYAEPPTSECYTAQPAPAAPYYAAPAAVCPSVAAPSAPSAPCYATPAPAPPSGTPAPPAAPSTPATPPKVPLPSVTESHSYYDAYPVSLRAAEKPAGGRSQVGFWNLTDREVTLKVDGETHVLEQGQKLKLDVGQEFVWKVDDREPQTTRVPLNESGLNVVIRK